MKAAPLAARWVRFSFASISLGLTLGLTACGGGNSSTESEGFSASNKALSAVSTAFGASVIAVTKVSETRVSRTVYDYVFKVTVQNGNLAQMGVLANLTAVGTGTTILDGSSVIGDMDVNALVTATDTITLRHDRTYAFDQGALNWNVSSTASAGTLAEVGLVNVNYGAGSDGNLYGIGGVELAKTIDVDALPSSATDQFILNVSCGAPKVSALFADGKWRLGISALDFPSGSAIPVCLQIVNTTLHKFVVVSFKAIGLAPTNSATTAIAPRGSGTLTTGDGYFIALSGNNLGKTVNATLFESQDPDGNRIVSITFDADVTNAGIAVKLPDVNAPVPSKTVLATRRIQATTAPEQPTKLPDTLPEPYPSNKGNLGKKWDQEISAAPDGTTTVRLNGTTRAWTLNGKSKVRIPQNELVIAQSPDAGWLCDKFTKPGNTPCSNFEVTNREVSALYSVLDQKSWDIGGAEVVVFINGYEPATPGEVIIPYIGGGSDTWGEFPRLSKNPKLFGGQRLIPFEFRWATNARFSDTANDLAKSVNLIRAQLNLGNTQKVHLVAHSFGGLLVRTLLQGLATPNCYSKPCASSDPNIEAARLSIKSVMTLGTPHSGIRFRAAPGSLPKGTDFELIVNCEQASCYEGGLDNIVAVDGSIKNTLTIDEKRILYGVDLKSYAGKASNTDEVFAGFLPIKLASNSTLPDINFYVGIGLRANSVLGNAGDALISYEGQRFSPLISTNKLLGNVVQGALTTENLLSAKVHEQILGTSYRPANNSELMLPAFAPPRTEGYGHQRWLPQFPNPVEDGKPKTSFSRFEGWGLEANVNGGCLTTNEDTDCQHASVLLLRKILTTPVPIVTSTAPTTLFANNTLQTLTINGNNFIGSSIVQYKSTIATNNAWLIVPLHDSGPVVTPTQITLTVLPQLGETSIDYRVCRLNPPVADGDCSASQTVALTAPPPPPPQGQNFREDFNGTTLNGNYWTGATGIGGYTVANSTVQFNRASSAHTNGKIMIEGGKIVVEARFGGLTSNGRDTNIALVDSVSGDRVQAGDTNYQGQGFYVYATGAYGLGQQSTGSPSTNAYLEYRMTLEDRTLTLERGPSLNNLNVKKVFTLPQSSIGRTYYLQIGTGGGIEYSPGTFDWIQFTATTVNVPPAPPTNFATICKGQSTVMGGWTRFGTSTYNEATNTYSVGDTIVFDPNDLDGDCNQVASWSLNGTNTQDNDWLVYNRSTTGDIDFSAQACISQSPNSGHSIGLWVVDPAFTGSPQSGHAPFTFQMASFNTQWNRPGQLYYTVGSVVVPVTISNAVLSAEGFCGTYRMTRVGNLYSVYFNNNFLGSAVGSTAAIVPVVQAYDNVVTMTPTVKFPN